VRAQSRRQSYESKYATERDLTVGGQMNGESEVLELIELRGLIEAHGDFICHNEDDGEIFLLMAAGERFHPAYLEVLNLDDTADNRAEVERRRERIRGRIRRLQPQLQS